MVERKCEGFGGWWRESVRDLVDWWRESVRDFMDGWRGGEE